MIVTVQTKSAESMSESYLFKISWDGGWEEGDKEILCQLKIQRIDSVNE